MRPAPFRQIHPGDVPASDLAHSVAVVDIKGELYRNTAGYRSTLGPVYVIDPEGYGDQYDPLHGLTDEDELYNVAKNLLFDPKEAEGRSFTEWGILLEVLKWQACLELNRQTGRHYRLLPFTRAMAKLGINPAAAAAINVISPQIAQELLDGEYDPEENYKENKYFANSWQSSRARMYPNAEGCPLFQRLGFHGKRPDRGGETCHRLSTYPRETA